MKHFQTGIILLMATFTFLSCAKNDVGFVGQGGNVPGYFIAVRDSSFSPGMLSVALGSTITFTNQSSIAHTIAGSDTSVIPPTLLSPGKSFKIAPVAAGTVSYHCATHPSVFGIINLNP